MVRTRIAASQLVMRLGQRFEFARRLSLLPAKPVKTESFRPEHRGLCQQYVSSRLLSQGLVPCVGVLQMVGGHSRWRRPILWYGRFDRCAWVSAGATSSKKLRPSD